MRLRDDYEESRWHRLEKWVDGDIDPLEGRMEIKPPDGEKDENTKLPEDGEPFFDEEKINSVVYDTAHNKELKLFRIIYRLASVLLCVTLIGVLLWTVVYLPEFGSPDNPINNEVSARYIEKGVEETGATNFVTGMILDYRAFDTFGESCVLFIAATCVLVLMRLDNSSSKEKMKKKKEEENDRLYEPKNDLILQKVSCVLVPLIFIFGIYIILNGHLSPGGGFSGGAVIGSGLILYLNAFGFKKTERFFTEKTFRRITLAALTFYCLAKSYSFFTGANHMESGIPLGTPGAILSSGLILPLNICVGLVVACTMYAFYTLFRKGGM
ncbi:hypothetical protein LQE92_01800 [Lacrimispora sp. NSJ-141]|uniref:Uncharacterized protein n=1 Tax=Lientehia hominis TaxID=2897778 RepID=A0AAP2RGU6_9FIRM|nr:hydrogen gas-evolving membrane-bound hydrogenase subunit E [Lientehia hominis]MCD2491360.1 hypothetical protein [Lientehia hominis]